METVERRKRLHLTLLEAGRLAYRALVSPVHVGDHQNDCVQRTLFRRTPTRGSVFAVEERREKKDGLGAGWIL